MNLRQATRRLARLARSHKVAVIKGEIESKIKRCIYVFAKRVARNMDPLRFLRPDPNAVESMRSMFQKLKEDSAKGLIIIPSSAKVEFLEVRKA